MIKVKVKLYVNQISYIVPKYHTRWRSWLRLCATSWKVAGVILDCVVGTFISA